MTLQFLVNPDWQWVYLMENVSALGVDKHHRALISYSPHIVGGGKDGDETPIGEEFETLRYNLKANYTF